MKWWHGSHSAFGETHEAIELLFCGALPLMEIIAWSFCYPLPTTRARIIASDDEDEEKG